MRPAKFGLNIALDEVFGCWIWLGKLNGKGYGPHWKVWEVVTGRSKPDGIHFDHTCRRRKCVNPFHGDLVTPSENQRRRAARNRVPERCPIGHRLVEPKRTPEGGFVCTICFEEQC